MWVARDKDNKLYLFTLKKPYKNLQECDSWQWHPTVSKIKVELFDSDLFPDLTWDDEPIEVEINRKGVLDAVYEDLRRAESLIH